MTSHVIGLTLVGVLVAATGCSGSDASSSRPTTEGSEAGDSAGETVLSLEDVDTTSLVVPRAPFCDRVDRTAVARALGDEAAEGAAHRSGERIRITDDVADVVHEFGCRWSLGDALAEAWVFAPPVTRKRARALVRDTLGAARCRGQVEAPAFGNPTASCLWSPTGGQSTMRLAGLFGDAWLACSLRLAATPRQEVVARTTQWCAAVARSAAAPSNEEND